MLDKVKSLLFDFENALSRLNDAIHTKIDTDLVMDAVIQRFEFTFEISWKLMQSFLIYQGIISNSPRQAIKETFKLGLIQDGDAWIDMLMDRNKTSHIYDVQEASIIYDKIVSQHVTQLNAFLSNIKRTIQDLLNDF